MINIEWRDVKGYEGYYEVSEYGNIRSLKRTIIRSDGVKQERSAKDKSVFITPDGYLYVKLSKDGIDKRKPVHAIVAEAFLTGWFEGAEINHIDYDRKNNHYTNLEWITHADNIKHTIIGGRHISQIRDMAKENNPNYGNRSLHQKYNKNKDLAKEKQSRPGVSNGRATPITIITESGEKISFPYIQKCAEYIISSGRSKAKNVLSVAGAIGVCARNNKKRYGCTFKFD